MTKESQWLLNEKYHGIETPEFHADIKRLKVGEPLAYIIGWVDFLGCRIDLAARPLIPRPETEFWVEQAIVEVSGIKYRVSRRKNSLKILDLFAGSGCIGIALLKHLPRATVDFGEKDPRLCKQIKKNIVLNRIDRARTRVIQTDVFSNITNSYDYIVGNPPYIDPRRMDSVQTSVLSHEPHEALFAEEGGLYFIKKLLTEGGAHLKKGGAMYVEFGENQKVPIAQLAKNAGWREKFQKDQFGKWRMIKVDRLSLL